MARSERYGRGEEPSGLSPGDFLLTHRHHFLAGLISLAEKRRFRGPDAVYAHWSHTAIIDADRTVIEAEIRGIVRSPISKYRDGEYHLVRLGHEVDAAARERIVGYARSRLGQAFGYLDMAGVSVYLLAGRPVHWVRGHHEICSSLVVRALQEGGLVKDLDPALTLPADLAKKFDVR